MNEQLLHLMALWSACFISRQGPVIILVGMRERLIELLEAIPPSFDGVDELRKQAALLRESETVGMDHPLNRAMYAFMVNHEKEFSPEFRTNVDNIKSFYSDLK